MSHLPEPTAPRDPRDIRASDADRHQVANVLRDAAGDGRLTLEELDERLDGVFAAKTYAELERFTDDLPAAGSSPSPHLRARPHAADPRIGGTPRHSFSIAVMSGAVRRGGWIVPPAYTAVAFMGGVQLDLRDARFSQREVTIRAFALMGGIEIIVPEDVSVIVDGVGIMGGFDDNASYTEAGSDLPVVRVTGLAFWGGVEVKRRRRKGSKSDDGAQPAIEE